MTVKMTQTVTRVLGLACLGLIGLSVATARPAQALELGDKAPCVVLDDQQTDGTTVNHCIRTKNPGTKFALLEFFSITCEYCQENMPRVAELTGQINGTTTVRLVSIDRKADQVKTYLEENKSNIRFPVSFDVDRDAKRAYDITAVPTTYILNDKNVVVYKHLGTYSDEDLNAIRELVK